MHYTCRKQLTNEENISLEVRHTQNMIEGSGYKKTYMPLSHGYAGSNIKLITSSNNLMT